MIVATILAISMAGQGRSFGESKPFVSLAEKAIDESSGIAASLTHKGSFWTHNDDGKVAEAWRFDAAGIKQKVELSGIPNRDMEDMASCKLNGKNFLYLADIGDNNARYSQVWVYRWEETGATTVNQVDRFEIAYDSGPMNAEAFFVDGKSGDFWIIEKGQADAARLLKVVNPKPGKNIAKKVGQLKLGISLPPARLITGAGLSPDGKHVVIRTYFQGFEYKFGPNWFDQKPSQFQMPNESQGEAICYSADGKSIFTSSEGTPCKVSQIAVR